MIAMSLLGMFSLLLFRAAPKRWPLAGAALI
jgi:hypothetical protein